MEFGNNVDMCSGIYRVLFVCLFVLFCFVLFVCLGFFFLLKTHDDRLN